MRVLLALVALALIAVVVQQWRQWPPPDPVADAVQPPPGEPERAGESPLALIDPPIDKEEYAVVTERPLFVPERRPPEEPQEEDGQAPEAAQNTDLARFDLSAVLIMPQERTAWVRDTGKADLLRLRMGDELEGWTVKEIREDELELERQGETDTLVLRDYEHHPPPTARPPKAASRPPSRPPGRGVQRPATTDRSTPQPRGARPPQTRLNANRPPPR